MNYYCTALVNPDGTYQAHPIDVPQAEIDARTGFHLDGSPIQSRMGSLASEPGEYPPAVFCEEHRGWATRVPLPTMDGGA